MSAACTCGPGESCSSANCLGKPLTVNALTESVAMRDKGEWPEPKMSYGLIGRLSRVVMDGEGEVALDLHECRAILQLDTAANLAVDFHAPKVKRDDEISKPMLALRKAVRRAP